MRKFNILIKKIIFPFMNLKEFFIYIFNFYEYLQGLNFNKKLNIVNNTNRKNSKFKFKNSLIKFYLKSKHKGMTKFIHYLENYEKDFEHLKKEKKKIKILEIGVFSGGSLEMYKNFFDTNKIEIIGIDIDEECLKFRDNVTNIHIGDQSDLRFLNFIKKKYSFFNIIIDDGSHIFEDQKKTFENLFSHVSYGGIYIIEDVSYRFINYLNGLISNFNKFNFNKNKIYASEIQKHIKKIEIIPNCVIIKKYEKNLIPLGFNAPWKGNVWTDSAKNLYKKFNRKNIT
jgi:hypothetical protein